MGWAPWVLVFLLRWASALPEADVACVTGEGSIQMNIQELSTCSQYGCPVKIINLRNDYLGMVKQWQDMQYEEDIRKATTPRHCRIS